MTASPGSPARAVKMIATDLDGTLLRSDGSVSERIRGALEAAVDAGIEVVPATGRPHKWSEDVIARLGFVDHWVFANGSVTWHLGRAEVLRGWWLDPEVAAKLVQRLRAELSTVRFAVETHHGVVYESGYERVVPGMPVLDSRADILDHLGHDIQKLLVLDIEVPDRDDLFDEVAPLVAGDAVTNHTGLPFIEIGAREVTKASALADLAGDLGIDRNEVIAFGDFHNDVEMLRWAGWSYAMGHAPADVVEAADQVIGSNDDDAVAAVVEAVVEAVVDRSG